MTQNAIPENILGSGSSARLRQVVTEVGPQICAHLALRDTLALEATCRDLRAAVRGAKGNFWAFALRDSPWAADAALPQVVRPRPPERPNGESLQRAEVMAQARSRQAVQRALTRRHLPYGTIEPHRGCSAFDSGNVTCMVVDTELALRRLTQVLPRPLRRSAPEAAHPVVVDLAQPVRRLRVDQIFVAPRMRNGTFEGAQAHRDAFRAACHELVGAPAPPPLDLLERRHWSPQGNAYVALQGSHQQLVRRRQPDVPQPLDAVAAAHQRVDWSPCGGRVALHMGADRWRVVAAADPSQRYDVVAQELVWHPRGDALALVEADGLQVVDAHDGAPHPGYFWAGRARAAWSGDGALYVHHSAGLERLDPGGQRAAFALSSESRSLEGCIPAWLSCHPQAHVLAGVSLCFENAHRWTLDLSVVPPAFTVQQSCYGLGAAAGQRALLPVWHAWAPQARMLFTRNQAGLGRYDLLAPADTEASWRRNLGRESAAVSPDGTLVAFSDHREVLQVVDLRDGARLRLAARLFVRPADLQHSSLIDRMFPDVPHTLRWSADMRRLAGSGGIVHWLTEEPSPLGWRAFWADLLAPDTSEDGLDGVTCAALWCLGWCSFVALTAFWWVALGSPILGVAVGASCVVLPALGVIWAMQWALAQPRLQRTVYPRQVVPNMP